jgi:iron complex transport system substrate-binding protein
MTIGFQCNVMVILLVNMCLPLLTIAAFEETASATIQVEDFRGRQLNFEAPVRRIVCLLDSALTGLYMLEAEQNVVGVSMTAYTGSSAPYYAAMDSRIREKSLPVVSNSAAGSLERILALKPELVIAFSLNKEIIAALEERGVAVFGVFIEKVEDIYKEVLAMGEMTGKASRARELVTFTRRQLSFIRERTQTVPIAQRPNTYFMWAKGEMDSGGRKSIVQELLDLTGAVNICGRINQEHVVISMEHLLVANPEVVIMWFNELMDPEDISTKPVWKMLSASKNHRIHEIPDLFCCDLWTLNFQYTVMLMANWCHPELFNELDLKQEAQTIFQKLYDVKLSDNPIAHDWHRTGSGL